MAQTNESRRFPGVGWLGSHLTRKMILALVALAAVSCFALWGGFLAYLGDFADSTYDEVLDQAAEEARQAGAFLEGCGAEASAMEDYLSRRGLACVVRDGGGNILYERIPDGAPQMLASSGTVEVTLSRGQTARLTVWSQALQRSEITQSLRSKALTGLCAINLGMFVVVALVMYLVLVSPIVRLRQTMRRYYEKGEQPERSQRMDEVGKLQNAFVDLAGVLDCKEKAEHRLIASISHDIKTPLTSVLGYSERLRSAELAEEKKRRYLELVYEKALRIKAVVDEFDEYLDAGLRDRAPMVLTTAGELCRRLRAEYADELADAGVEFPVECLCPDAQLICNWEHMRRLFGNLISNAFQHAGAERLELSLTCRREEEQAVFLFRDNGKGVPPELLRQIFEPLYTSDQGRKVSGLGLSICKSIAKAHGGGILADNAPDGGLVIRMSLPIVDL